MAMWSLDGTVVALVLSSTFYGVSKDQAKAIRLEQLAPLPDEPSL